MRKRSILVIGALLFSSCASSIHKVPQANYHQLSNQLIYLSTKDEIVLVPAKGEEMKPIQRKMLKKAILEYTIHQDTLKFVHRNRIASVAFSEIKSLRFNGVVDPDLGLVSEQKLAQHRGSRRTKMSILLTLLGAPLGAFAGNGLANALSDREDIGSTIVGIVAGGLLGTFAGGILGYNIGYKADTHEALQTIKHGKKDISNN